MAVENCKNSPSEELVVEDGAMVMPGFVVVSAVMGGFVVDALIVVEISSVHTEGFVEGLVLLEDVTVLTCVVDPVVPVLTGFSGFNKLIRTIPH